MTNNLLNRNLFKSYSIKKILKKIKKRIKLNIKLNYSTSDNRLVCEYNKFFVLNIILSTFLCFCH